LTYKVVAYQEVPNFSADEWVDWALEMLELGYDTPSLMLLASQSKPTNYFQTIQYFNETAKELNLQLKRGDAATISYCSYFIKKIATGISIRENLAAVYRFCQAKGYEGLVFNFYLLYWAWDDLDNGYEMQCYWSAADKTNIEAIVVETSQKWLVTHQEHYTQHHIAKTQA
jgi:ubiquinone/menaquinone biosynthesis C-methylase UbiE